MDIKITCIVCKTKRDVQKMVFEEERLTIIPDCGHIHEAVPRHSSLTSFGHLTLIYTEIEAEKINNTNNWKLIRYKGDIIPENWIQPDGTVILKG